MRVRELAGQGTCEACGQVSVPIRVVFFERCDVFKLLCDGCLEYTRELLEILDVKEAEA